MTSPHMTSAQQAAIKTLEKVCDSLDALLADANAAVRSARTPHEKHLANNALTAVNDASDRTVKEIQAHAAYYAASCDVTVTEESYRLIVDTLNACTLEAGGARRRALSAVNATKR